MFKARVVLLPKFVRPEELVGGIAVVIDILRATTTITHALGAGAECVVPFSEVEEAKEFAAGIRTGKAILGGERHGRLIEGFDLDNSPLAYTADRIQGRTVVFTTTNGTRTLAAARSAARVLIGSFSNRKAILGELRRDGRPVTLICASTDGQVTAEDVLFAGSVAGELNGEMEDVEAVQTAAIEQASSNDPDMSTRMAVAYFRSCGTSFGKRLEALRESRGGRNLIEIGQEADIARAATEDLFAFVPEWDRVTGRITITSGQAG